MLRRYKVTAELGNTFVVFFMHFLTDYEVENCYHCVLLFSLADSAEHLLALGSCKVLTSKCT
jgi:hypothetical protein